MITEEKLNNLYNTMIAKKEINVTDLKNNQFSKKEVKALINAGLIEQISMGIYKVISANDLYTYGKKLIEKNNFELAKKCFNVCLEIDPIHYESALQLFYYSVTENDYSKAYSYIDIMYENKDIHHINDTNFYLFLLGFLTHVPDKYVDIIRQIKYVDVCVYEGNYKYKNIDDENIMRREVLHRNLTFALKKVNDLMGKKRFLNFHEILTKKLLTKSADEEKKSQLYIYELVRNKKYEEVVKHLNEKPTKNNLSYFELNILRIVRDIIQIQTTKQLPEVESHCATQYHHAICAKDYELALLMFSDVDKSQVSIKHETLNILLTDICALINKTRKEEDIIFKGGVVTFDITIPDIINALQFNELVRALGLIKNYLKRKYGHLDYLFLIITTIKVCIAKNDASFSKLLALLADLEHHTYVFDENEYIEMFNESLDINRFNSARLALTALTAAKDLEMTNVNIEDLNNKHREKQIIFAEQENRKRTTSAIGSGELDAFLQVKYEELMQNHGIILLENFGSDLRSALFKKVKTLKNASAMSLKDENDIKIVFKYSEPPKRDFGLLISLGLKAKDKEEYDDAIVLFKEALQYIKVPVFLYAEIGLLYLKQKDYASALQYMTVARLINKKHDKEDNYQEVIDEIKIELAKSSTPTADIKLARINPNDKVDTN